MDTKFLTKAEAQADRKWWIIDASGKRVGRVATEVASLLRGKHKPSFTPNQDCGDFVILINAEKIEFTGSKLEQKKYYRHSGYAGGIKEITAGDLLERHPSRVITKAVKNMLPKNTLGRQILTKLKVCIGEEHSHQAQKPQVYNFKYIN